MVNRDMFRYREGREESRLVKVWQKNYKKSVFIDNIILCYSSNKEGKEDEVKQLREHSYVAEIAVDTIIGWLNSPVGRMFLSEALDVSIPKYGTIGKEIE